jgi:peptidase C39-like protein
MTTGLWIAASRMGDALLDAIPPSCRRVVAAPPPARIDGSDDDVLVEALEWPVAGATHFVPSFAALTSIPYGMRLELSVRMNGAWSGWSAGVGLAGAPFEPLPPVDGLAVDIDVFRARIPVDAARLRLRLHGRDAAAVMQAPWLLALSAAGPPPASAIDTAPGVPGARLDVPARSQMEAPAAIAPRICSPTCVAMVLDFWQRPSPLEPLAAEMFHAGVGLYGVWPAAIIAAGRRGLAGYLLRFPDWAAAAWCLAQGLPIIASVRYGAGELTGAAVAETPGHLIVLTGWDGDQVFVNDPAAPTAASVCRRYRLAELVQVWLARAGVGYVLFPPGAPLRGG